MSDFACEKCGAICHDTDKGYVTGCAHYPIDVINPNKCPICGGVADNGYDRCVPQSAYTCKKCEVADND